MAGRASTGPGKESHPHPEQMHGRKPRQQLQTVCSLPPLLLSLLMSLNKPTIFTECLSAAAACSWRSASSLPEAFRGCRDTPGSKSVSCQACPGHPSSDSLCPWGQQGLLSLLTFPFNCTFPTAVHSSMSLASNKVFAHLEFWKFVTRLPKGKETSWPDVRAEGHKERDRGLRCQTSKQHFWACSGSC